MSASRQPTVAKEWTKGDGTVFTTKGAGKGTGLGLSMVHGMTEQMGGCLVLKSSRGTGTSAELWLPIATASSEVARGPDVLTEEVIEAVSLRILAVDDGDALVLLNTAAMLEDLGHTVAKAHSAAAFLALLEEHRFDPVITDYAMPKTTGLQLSKAIKDKWPSVPVIVATGYAELPGTPEIKILSKPFTEKELASAITSVRFIGPPARPMFRRAKRNTVAHGCLTPASLQQYPDCGALALHDRHRGGLIHLPGVYRQPRNLA